ncbi:uncharacterized protein LOC131616860 isoform X2 [Vicia villosa]|uniref:uncharacterized protein LOC131616860 isoform X2 n=1 Tax=Vicia villosa TaxID=3911 RepID=UPI00273BA264|nr:uncharacterized protein LOC131616860 isoform X2 [Vicia villosa]
MENKNVDNLFNEFAYKGSSEGEHPKKTVFLSPYFPYKGNTRNTFYRSPYSCSSRKVSKHFREVGESKVGDSCPSRKVSKYFVKDGESKVGDSCPSRKVSKYFVKDGESKVGDSCPSRKVSKYFVKDGESKVGDSCPSRKVSKYFVKDGESKVGDSCPSRKVSKYFAKDGESKVGDSCSRKVPKHFREVGESKEDDSCPSRKVSKYFREVGEPEVGNSCPSRRTSKYFGEVGESKVSESCTSSKVSKYFVKVDDSKVSDSCRSRNLLEHFWEVEELELDYQKRVSPCSSRKVKNNRKSMTGFRECVKKRKCKGIGVIENLKVEDSSCLAKIYEYLAKVEEIIIKGSLLLQKVSDSSRGGYQVEENCMKEINDFLNQYVYHGRSVPISRKCVKKSENLEEGGDSEYRAKVKEAKIKFESILGDLSNSFQEGPKVEEGSSLVPPKMKSKSRGKKTQPFHKAERYKEAYKRKSAENNWLPPRSHWNLIQEDHFHDPWRVLVICMLLNRTTGAQVCGGCLCYILYWKVG